MATVLPCGSPTATQLSKGTGWLTKPAWRIWRGIAPMRSRSARIRCPGACSCGSRRSSPSQGQVTRIFASTLSAKRRTLERQLSDVLSATSSCDLTRALQAKISRARDQLLTFLDHPGAVEATNNACERALRPAVVQRKVTNGYRAMWAAQGEAAIRTVVDTARLASGAIVISTVLATVRV